MPDKPPLEPVGKPRIVYITAGAAGMFCGSCIRDNALVAGLRELGWDTTLLPLYTPIRVDEQDHSVDQLFFGGINVFLQQKIPLFRYLPTAVDRWLDTPGLIKRVASRSMSVSAAELGALTLSMVKGEDGYQRKEVKRLVRWLKEEAKPDLICLTNLLVGGAAPAFKRELGVPVLVTLQGDDVFLDELKEPWRTEVLAEMRRLAREVDGFIAFSVFYEQHMRKLLKTGDRPFYRTPLGIEVEEFKPVFSKRKERISGRTIGFFARLSPEKGLDLLVDAFVRLGDSHSEMQLHVGGWLAEKDREFFDDQCRKIKEAGLEDRFAALIAPERDAKLNFLGQIDIFCVPTRFVEPKGMYLLEAMVCGIPAVAPDTGVFTEMIRESGGGRLFDPENSEDLDQVLEQLMADSEALVEMGECGHRWAITAADRRAMAESTAAAFENALRRHTSSIENESGEAKSQEAFR